MEPEYPVGSLVYVKKTPAEDINTGDVITFHINENTLVTHRVIEKDSMNNIFNTKGDANEVKDGGQVAYENIVGKVIFSIPYLGIIAGYFNTLNGQYVITAMIIILFASVFLPDIIKILKKSDMENMSKKQKKLAIRNIMTIRTLKKPDMINSRKKKIQTIIYRI